MGAEFSYNDGTGFGSEVSITGTGSQALNNGYTASASLTLTDNNATPNDEVVAGDITIANDNSSITYYVDMEGTGAAYLGDPLGKQGDLLNIFEESTASTEDAGITASASLGGATVSMS